MAIAARVLDGVDRDDHPVEVRERVATGRDPLTHPLDPLGVQADERDAGAAPQLVLYLVEDVARNDGENPCRTPAALQLGEQHPDLDRLAEPDGVGDEQPGLKLGHRRPERLTLVRQVVREHPMADA